MDSTPNDWASLVDRAVLANPDVPPAGWTVVSASRSAVLFKVDQFLVKRVAVVGAGAHAAPLERVAIEARAPQYLGRWAPETLCHDPVRGVLVRRFVTGEPLRGMPRDRIDPAFLARELGRFLEHAAAGAGPDSSLRPLATMCRRRLKPFGDHPPDAFDALIERILSGSHPAHGDLSASNMIVGGDRVMLIDAETFDRASVAWDLGHALVLSDWLGIASAEWRRFSRLLPLHHTCWRMPSSSRPAWRQRGPQRVVGTAVE